MKKLKIETISNGSIHLIVDENGETAASCRADETSQEKAKLYAGRLTLAYNHTYGEGINPRAVPELLKVCKKAMESEIDGSYVAASDWWGAMKDAIKNALLE